MDDTFGPVRDATAEALGTLLKVMGERPLNPYIEQLDKIKMDKVMFWLLPVFYVICNENVFHDCIAWYKHKIECVGRIWHTYPNLRWSQGLA